MCEACHKNQPDSYTCAKQLRDAGSFVEKLLWRVLRHNASHTKTKFRYQHPISPYIVDFACLSARLIVEIDGSSHDATPEWDRKREQFLKAQGFELMRISNAEVLNDVVVVAETIMHRAEELQQNRWNGSNPSPKLQSNFDPPARGG
jgi:very-short-patch-repair endonuclease